MEIRGLKTTSARIQETNTYRRNAKLCSVALGALSTMGVMLGMVGCVVIPATGGCCAPLWIGPGFMTLCFSGLGLGAAFALHMNAKDHKEHLRQLEELKPWGDVELQSPV